jgi:hypothetical protein
MFDGNERKCVWRGSAFNCGPGVLERAFEHVQYGPGTAM